MTQFDSLFKNKSDLPKPSPTGPSTTYKSIQQLISPSLLGPLCPLPLLEPFALILSSSGRTRRFPNIFCNNIKRTTQISHFFYTSRQESKVQICFFCLFFFVPGVTAHHPHHAQTTKRFQPMENYYNGTTEQDQQVKSHLSLRLFLFLVIGDGAVTVKNETGQIV